MKDIVIIGAGGVGRETAQLIEDINENKKQWNVIGFIDDNKNMHNTIINGYPVLGGSEWLNNYDNEVYSVCALGYAKVKKMALSKINNVKIKFANLVHPSAIISNHVTMGYGIIVQSNCVISINVKLGNHVQINPQCGIAHDTIIGDYTSLFWNVNVSGNVNIGAGCVFGTKSTIIQGLNIGDWSIIGSQANVIRDVPGDCTVVGNPGRIIKG